MTRTRRRAGVVLASVVVLGVTVGGCGSDDDGDDAQGDTSGTAGATQSSGGDDGTSGSEGSSGGTGASAGSAASGAGSSAGDALGGSTGKGGASPSGGTGASAGGAASGVGGSAGGALGGSTGKGGASPSGGTGETGGTGGDAPASGGRPGNGGMSGAGGSVATGGSSGTSGTAEASGASGAGAEGGASGGGGTAGDGGTSGEGGTVYGVEGQSCSAMTGTECQGESCCTSIVLPAGSYPMGRSTEDCAGCTDGCPPDASCIPPFDQPEHPATLSAFALDKYEVTVGRFAAFVDAYDGGWRPSVGDGANAAAEAAQGLATGETGWESDWDEELPADGVVLEGNLMCQGSKETWGQGVESYPMNCVNWYEAFAFCIWDGGRLPTEAEWEYAAAGGDENRLYPWGDNVTEPLPANYSSVGFEVEGSPFISVGSNPLGNGRWGHADLAGSMHEWVRDWYTDDWYTTTQSGCSDCVGLTGTVSPILRGGHWDATAGYLRAASRDAFPADQRRIYDGWRCARSAP